ncbi:MAG: UDP-N-acetylmuramoyl-L-alanine--D-glutamate ligase [Propionibacteriales bacterium]|nr:UDP-N-acetylmuramoyl-L-alanine--D-glutamate ligase [Propionibacteriales bacterium]
MGGRGVSAVEWLPCADRESRWPEVRVVVAGIGASGFAAADALARLGARVTVVDEGEDDPHRAKAAALEALGAGVRLGPGAADTLPDTDLVVASPGWRPTAAVLRDAVARRVPVWGEVELAWRLRGPDPAPWLCVTGTNGKTTTTEMLASMLRASGARTIAAGNVGTPLLEAVTDPKTYDVIAVELSSFQLHWAYSPAAEAAVVLNVAPDHLDWHGSLEAYTRDKARIYQRCRVAAVYNVADRVTETMVREADTAPGCRVLGFTLDVPRPGMLGVIDGVLADRAFVDDPEEFAAELCPAVDVRPAGPHNVGNALAAAALARAYGLTPAAVGAGLRQFEPVAHRVTVLGELDGVAYVNDSKATNPHAAAAALHAYDPVVWIAGGLAKGASFDELVQQVRERLRGVVLLGTDRRVIADALARHAPEVPLIEVDDGETSIMDRVVREAARMAVPGDTVLLAPGCASWDQFANYTVRGDDFAAAAARLGVR